MTAHRITSVQFSKYKTFWDFSLSLGQFNVLVGPNNAGKSTILGAFRILAEAIRKARAKNPVLLESPGGQQRGYEINLSNIPVATENVFYNYDESESPVVKFRVSNGNVLKLFFPAPKICHLFCETKTKPVVSTTTFRNAFPVDIGIVPILGPVEHNEQLYQKEAAREALLSHRASRNFRNIWYHYPERFEEFREFVQSSWPGMDIQLPEIDDTHDKPMLRMFCPEGRIPREIFWSGFGFQVWCQMLTFIVASKSSSLLLIDEPDIYLHSDLQRQLISILRALGPDILIATHSTEIITEVDANDLYLISKKQRSAKPVKSPEKIRDLFSTLGSNSNPILTQIAKTKRLLFVEGKDFIVLSKFAAKLGYRNVALRTEFAVIPAEGYNAAKVKSFTEGVKSTLGENLVTAVLFDRDYRSENEIARDKENLKNASKFVHIHSCKEIENHLFVPDAITRTIIKQIEDRKLRSSNTIIFNKHIRDILSSLTNEMEAQLYGQWSKQRVQSIKSMNSSIDDATINKDVFLEFKEIWSSLESRLRLVSGKELLSRLNQYLQTNFLVSVTATGIIESMSVDEIPTEIATIIEMLDHFSKEIP